MFQRQRRTGSILCPSCGKLVGVSDEVCLNCGRKNPGMWGLSSLFAGIGKGQGLVQVVIGGTMFLYLAMLAVDPGNIGMGSLWALGAPSQESIVRFGASGAAPVFGLGRWWTILSAGWLHGSLLHIAFNLYWIRFLAPETAELYGVSRTVILYTLSSAFAFAATSTLGLYGLGGAFLTVGASAPISGLVGALVHYGRRTGSSLILRQAWSYAIMTIVIGFVLPRADNVAHVGGFIGGYLASLLLDPMKPERGNHTVAAVVCLAATAASILASLVIPIGR